MELDDAIFPNLALHMENYLEEEEAEGRPAAWLVTQAQLSQAHLEERHASCTGRHKPGDLRCCFCKEQTGLGETHGMSA